MTVILTLVHRNYLIQASDRLVSMVDRASVVPVDPTANKSVVYRALDGVLTVGFAGRARIRGIPADDWIVETLMGEPLGFPEAPDGHRMGNRVGGNLRLLTVPQAAWRLQEAIKRDIPRASQQSFELAIGGLRYRRGQLIPYWTDMIKPVRRDLRIVGRSPRFPDARGRYMTIYNGNITDGDALDLHARLKSLGKTVADTNQRNPSVEEVAETMVQHVRELSGKRKGVGPNVLTVALTDRGGYSQFHNVHRFPLGAMNGNTVVMEARDSAQTPWIVAKGIQTAPSFAVGNMDYDLNGYPFRVIGAKPEGRVLGMHTSIRSPSLDEMQRRFKIGVSRQKSLI